MPQTPSPAALCSNGPPSAVDAALPYELRALEAALSAAARLLEAETSTLEARALPSLHSLTQKVRAPAARVRGGGQGRVRFLACQGQSQGCSQGTGCLRRCMYVHWTASQDSCPGNDGPAWLSR